MSVYMLMECCRASIQHVEAMILQCSMFRVGTTLNESNQGFLKWGWRLMEILSFLIFALNLH